MERLRGQRVRLIFTAEALVSSYVGRIDGWNEQFVFLTDDDGDYFAFNVKFIGSISVLSETNP